jgi:hypothetical protein
VFAHGKGFTMCLHTAKTLSCATLAAHDKGVSRLFANMADGLGLGQNPPGHQLLPTRVPRLAPLPATDESPVRSPLHPTAIDAPPPPCLHLAGL